MIEWYKISAWFWYEHYMKTYFRAARLINFLRYDLLTEKQTKVFNFGVVNEHTTQLHTYVHTINYHMKKINEWVFPSFRVQSYNNVCSVVHMQYVKLINKYSKHVRVRWRKLQVYSTLYKYGQPQSRNRMKNKTG